MIDQLEARLRDALTVSLAETPNAPSASDIARFLDTTMTVQPTPEPAHRSNRSLVMAGVAVAAAVIGLVVIVSTRPVADTASSASAVVGWVIVDDPTSQFMVEPGIAEMTTPDGIRMTSTNSISVYHLEPTSHGLIAVGAEQDGFARTAAIWRSSNGTAWERVDDTGVLGALDDRDDPTTPTSMIVDIAEFQGRLIAIGNTQPAGTAGSLVGSSLEPAAWASDDGSTWTRLTLPEAPLAADGTGAMFTAITTTSTGWATVVSNGQIDEFGRADGTSEVWTTTTGTDWTRSTPIPAGAMIESIAAIPAGTIIGGTDSTGQPIVWTSADNASWQRVPLPSDGIGFVARIIQIGDTAVAISSTSSAPGVGYSQTDTGFALEGTSSLRIWTSTDGLTWQTPPIPTELAAPQQWTTSAAGSPTGAVIAVRTMDVNGPAVWTLTTADGHTWTAAPTTTPGTITAIASIDTTWVAASTGDLDPFAPDTHGTSNSRNTVILTATTS